MDRVSLAQHADFRSVFDHFDEVAIWTASQLGQFDYVSAGVEKIWDVPVEVLQDDLSHLMDGIHPADRDDVLALIDRTVENLSEGSLEHRVVRPDGTVRWVHARVVALQDDDGQLTDLVGITTDITAQKRRERELELLNRLIRHDIRNDVTIIHGWATMLDDHVDDEGRAYLQNILASAEHVAELTDSARNYAENLIGGDEIAVEPTSLRSVLATELSLRAEAFPNATFVRPEEIPDVEVVANSMLSSVFRNLLNNAVQHNDVAEPIVDVSVEVRPEAVVVRIADDGPGLADDQKETVFENGTQGLEHPGTGVGLSLVETLVDQYDGDVWAEDNDPTGTVFVVELPRADR